ALRGRDGPGGGGAVTVGGGGVPPAPRRYLPPQDAERIAAGWGGDRLAAFARGQDTVIVWLTAWDSDTDAVDFAGAFAVIQPEATVQRRGTRVLVLLGPAPPDLADRICRQPSGRPKRAQSSPPPARLSSVL